MSKPTIQSIREIIKGKMVDKTIKTSYEELSELIFGEGNSYSETETRKRLYGVKYILDLLEEEDIDSTVQQTAEEVFEDLTNPEVEETEDEIALKLKELELMKIQYQDQKRENQAFLRAEARFNHLREEIIKTIEKQNLVYTSFYQGDVKSKTTCASLILSDWHVGMVIQDELNCYNNDIALERMTELKNKTISYCHLHNVKQLNIELLGDLVHGIIHTSTRVFSEEDVVSQTMRVSAMIASLINDLAKEVPIVEVYSCIGNHARVSANMKDSIQAENFERLVTWYLQGSLKNPNVNIHDCSTDMIRYTNMLGKRIICMHGNNDKPNQVASNYVRMYREIPDEIHLGHLHTYSEKDEYDIDVLVNGSLCSMDDFAKSIRKYSKPCQVLRIYGEDVATYKLKLK